MSDVFWLLLTATGVFALALLAAAGVLRWLPGAARAQRDRPAGRLASLDGLRGFLALAVFIHHAAITWFFLQSGSWASPPSRLLIHAGGTAVSLFFMVTAFLFWGRVLDRGNQLSWRELYIGRIARLAPLYLFVLALMLLICFARGGWQLAVPLAELAGGLGHWLLFTLLAAPDLNGFASTGNLMAGVVWSLRYEWMFYLALPVLALGCGAWRAWRAALFGVAALALLLCFINPAVFADPSRQLCFLGGFVAAHWVRAPALRALASGLAAAAVALVALGLVLTLSETPFAWAPQLGLTVFFTVVASGNDLFGLLRLRAAAWLGEISYSVYLLHGLLLWLVFRAATPGISLPIYAYCLCELALGVGLVIFASLSCVAIEWPGIEAGRSLCLRLRAMRSGIPVAALSRAGH